MGTAKIIGAEDHGSIWRLLYREDSNGEREVDSDWRQFAHFYEGITGRDYYKDYCFGRGANYISQQLENIRIRVEGEPFNEVVIPED
jgi:hypothetical protein